MRMMKTLHGKPAIQRFVKWLFYYLCKGETGVREMFNKIKHWGVDYVLAASDHHFLTRELLEMSSEVQSASCHPRQNLQIEVGKEY